MACLCTVPAVNDVRKSAGLACQHRWGPPDTEIPQTQAQTQTRHQPHHAYKIKIYKISQQPHQTRETEKRSLLIPGSGKVTHASERQGSHQANVGPEAHGQVSAQLKHGSIERWAEYRDEHRRRPAEQRRGHQRLPRVAQPPQVWQSCLCEHSVLAVAYLLLLPGYTNGPFAWLRKGMEIVLCVAL